MLYLIVSIAVSCLLTAIELPLLRRLKAGQSIREEGPQWHQKKSGTPTMGGIAIVLALCIVSLAFSPSKEMLAMCAVTFVYAAIGFVDDFIKVVMKRNLGLTAIQKLVLQIAAAVAFAVYCGITQGTYVTIPFIKTDINLGWIYYPFVAFVMVAMTNAVNLTDGLDGLASSVTAIVSLTFFASCAGDASIFAICICGACIGFLFFNRHPAKLFMGDTGSLALGGALGACAILSGKVLILPVAGGIYVLEALSVIIQVFVFKTQNGRRFFRMAPIHHHFELGGWTEKKVVLVFCICSVILSGIAYFII